MGSIWLCAGSSSRPRTSALTSASGSHTLRSHEQENLDWGGGGGNSESLAWWWWIFCINLIGQEWLVCGPWDFRGLLQMKNCIFVHPKAAEFALSLSFMSFYPEVLTLKVSQRSRVVCWENGQWSLTLWLREGFLTQKHPLGREGYLSCLFRLCATVSGFSPRLKHLQALLCLETLSLG